MVASSLPIKSLPRASLNCSAKRDAMGTQLPNRLRLISTQSFIQLTPIAVPFFFLLSCMRMDLFIRTDKRRLSF